MATSLGGLKTSTSFEVYDENEQAIDGLYACGEVIGGVSPSSISTRST